MGWSHRFNSISVRLWLFYSAGGGAVAVDGMCGHQDDLSIWHQDDLSICLAFLAPHGATAADSLMLTHLMLIATLLIKNKKNNNRHVTICPVSFGQGLMSYITVYGIGRVRVYSHNFDM